MGLGGACRSDVARAAAAVAGALRRPVGLPRDLGPARFPGHALQAVQLAVLALDQLRVVVLRLAGGGLEGLEHRGGAPSAGVDDVEDVVLQGVKAGEEVLLRHQLLLQVRRAHLEQDAHAHVGGHLLPRALPSPALKVLPRLHGRPQLRQVAGPCRVHDGPAVVELTGGGQRVVEAGQDPPLLHGRAEVGAPDKATCLAFRPAHEEAAQLLVDVVGDSTLLRLFLRDGRFVHLRLRQPSPEAVVEEADVLLHLVGPIAPRGGPGTTACELGWGHGLGVDQPAPAVTVATSHGSGGGLGRHGGGMGRLGGLRGAGLFVPDLLELAVRLLMACHQAGVRCL